MSLAFVRVTGSLPSQSASNAKIFPFDGVVLDYELIEYYMAQYISKSHTAMQRRMPSQYYPEATKGPVWHTISGRLWDILVVRALGTIHYIDVIMTTMTSQITSLTIVYSTIYSGADQSKHQSSASLAFVWGIHREPVNSPHKWPVTRKMFPFDDVIMGMLLSTNWKHIQ